MVGTAQLGASRNTNDDDSWERRNSAKCRRSDSLNCNSVRTWAAHNDERAAVEETHSSCDQVGLCLRKRRPRPEQRLQRPCGAGNL